MRKHRLYLSVFLFGGMGFVILALLAMTTVRNAMRDKALIIQNALTQGYWIARSLEIGHSMMMQDHTHALHDIIEEVEQKPDVRFLVVLDANRQVLIASDTSLEGARWPDDLGEPPETGRVIKGDARQIELVYPAFFARVFQRMQHHPYPNGTLDAAKWIVVGLDASEGHAHYRGIVMQSVFVSLSLVLLVLGAFLFFGIIQRYQLASASIVQLERIKQNLARFVPGTVQRLIEENPEQPMLDKVERDATVLFLDVDHYTKISADMSPDALNQLIETYFAAFLDTILSHGGEINETAGDAIMAIFTARSPQTHALNAARAAVGIREQATTLNHQRASDAPEILVNIGINTGPVLLGATMFKGEVGERFTYTASGMVTNIASRLCEIGSKGEIHLSRTTADLISDQFALQGPFNVNLKNVGTIVPVYQIG